MALNYIADEDRLLKAIAAHVDAAVAAGDAEGAARWLQVYCLGQLVREVHQDRAGTSELVGHLLVKERQLQNKIKSLEHQLRRPNDKQSRGEQ